MHRALNHVQADASRAKHNHGASEKARANTPPVPAKSLVPPAPSFLEEIQDGAGFSRLHPAGQERFRWSCEARKAAHAREIMAAEAA